jgi:hypothetical protein
MFNSFFETMDFEMLRFDEAPCMNGWRNEHSGDVFRQTDTNEFLESPGQNKSNP